MTIVPVLSQSQPPVKVCKEEDLKRLIAKIQEAGTTVRNKSISSRLYIRYIILSYKPLDLLFVLTNK